MSYTKELGSMKSYNIANTQWNRYVRARDSGHKDYCAMAKKCDEFYQGNQWDANDLAILDEQDRPALTINMILSTINAIKGEQSSRKVDFRVKAKRSTTNELAEVVEKVMNHVGDQNKLHRLEGEVFADGLIMDGRGFFDVRMDFSKSLEGDIAISTLDPTEVYLDPDAKEYDPKTWNEIIISRWHTLEEIKEAYGAGVSRKLKFLCDSGGFYHEDSFEFNDRRFGNAGGSLSTIAEPSVDEPQTIKNIRIIERQHMKVARVDYYIDPETGDKSKVPANWNRTKRRGFAKRMGLEILSETERKIRWTVTCDKVVLHDSWSPYETFTVIPYFAYFRRGRPFGVVRNLLSSQEQLNKTASQELHIINTTANSGWLVETGSLTTMDPEDLEASGSKTGVVIEYNKASTPPEKIKPNSVPTGLDRVSQKAVQNIKTISGVTDAMLGTDSPEVSGVAIEKKQNRGSVLMQVPLENLDYTRELLADKILNLIQKFYSEERIFYISDDGVDDPLDNQQMLHVNVPTAEGIVNDLTIGDYAIKINTSPARDTFDEVQFAESLALRNVGVNIPDDVIVGYSHLAKRDKLAQRMRIENGVEQTPEQQQMAELQQQVMMMQLEMQLQQLAADIQKTQSEVELNAAKAAQLGYDPQIKLAELQSEYDMRMRELDLRRELANITHETRMAQSETNVALKLATTAMQTAQKDSNSNVKDSPKRILNRDSGDSST